jgi:hypothetical protein
MAELGSIGRQVIEPGEDQEADQARVPLLERGTLLLIRMRHDSFPGCSWRCPNLQLTGAGALRMLDLMDEDSDEYDDHKADVS